jgi:two-component system NtrC family response regulator
MPATILLVEDHTETARLIAAALRSPPQRFAVITATSARDALARIAASVIDCVLLDYRLPDTSGLECLRRLRREQPDLPIIMITGCGSEDIAVEAMKLGAADYVVKHGRYVLTIPLVVRETLGRCELARAAKHYRSALRSARREVTRLRRELRERFSLDGIIGESPLIEQALDLAERAAHTHATVLIEGESGTGKELFARAIHYHGARARAPFLAVNCAALPETLLDSDLFGHVRGAFTGADQHRRGLFEEAAGGTLFLDEVSETSPVTQSKLLRVLQEKQIRPVGSSSPRSVDVRVIAASNRDLRAATDDGVFRQDLYYRLRVFPISLPALRDRPQDIPLLARHFLERYAAEEGKSLAGLEPEALGVLERYAWPGNIRELQNEMHRIVLCAETGERVGVEHLSPWIAEAATGTGLPSSGALDGTRPLKEILREVEAATVQARLREHGYRRAATAKSLGITREALWAKLRHLGLDARLPGDDIE